MKLTNTVTAPKKLMDRARKENEKLNKIEDAKREARNKNSQRR